MATSSPVPFQEGKIPFKHTSRDPPYETYYKVYGDIHQASTTPLIILHGGPGAGHEYIEPLSLLWTRYNIPTIFYDQIGCASSTHLPETKGDRDFWQPSLFVAELDNLIAHFKLTKYHVLGHSWGGSLAVEFAARQPPGLQRLILAGANASLVIFKHKLWDLLQTLPAEHFGAVQEANEANDFTGQAYKAAMGAFLSTYLCRGRPFPPPELAKNFKNQADDETVRLTLMGSSPFVFDGTIGDWDGIPLLHKINVPTLVQNAEFDTAQYVTTVPFFEHIPKVRWVEVPGGSHMPWLDSDELKERVVKLFGEFLLPDGTSH